MVNLNNTLSQQSWLLLRFSGFVEYYNLYKDLIGLWQSQYGDKIYNLNYENLTTDQEIQTRKLIKHLELNWEEVCHHRTKISAVSEPPRNSRSDKRYIRAVLEHGASTSHILMVHLIA